MLLASFSGRRYKPLAVSVLPMQIALFTKVLADHSLRETCEIAADIGYDGIELMGRDPHFGVETTDQEAHALRDYLDSLGLSVPCIATYTGFYVGKTKAECESELADLERFCELADILGVDLIRHGPGGPSPYEATTYHYRTGAAWMREAAELAATYDKELGVEIHGNTLVESATDAVRLLELIDHDNVGIIHDAGNMFIFGNEYGLETIETLGDRLRHVHVKDEHPVESDAGPSRFAIETEEGTARFEATLLGAGTIDHSTLFEALCSVGYDGFLTDECHAEPTDDRDDVSIAEREYEAMTRLVAGKDR
jgi:L-ribulose-5-phosphate 3-epimerase